MPLPSFEGCAVMGGTRRDLLFTQTGSGIFTLTRLPGATPGSNALSVPEAADPLEAFLCPA